MSSYSSLDQEALSEVFGAVHHEVALEALLGGPAQHTMKKTGMNISENIEKKHRKNIEKTWNISESDCAHWNRSKHGDGLWWDGYGRYGQNQDGWAFWATVNGAFRCHAQFGLCRRGRSRIRRTGQS